MSVVAMIKAPELDYEPATFEDLWCLYPKRVAKKDAKCAWEKLTPDQKIAALVGLVVWRRIWIERGEMDFVPHCGSWLRGERWEDEPPADAVKAVHASHKLAEVKDTTRGEMPAHVKELLAKMRGK